MNNFPILSEPDISGVRYSVPCTVQDIVRVGTTGMWHFMGYDGQLIQFFNDDAFQDSAYSDWRLFWSEVHSKEWDIEHGWESTYWVDGFEELRIGFIYTRSVLGERIRAYRMVEAGLRLQLVEAVADERFNGKKELLNTQHRHLRDVEKIKQQHGEFIGNLKFDHQQAMADAELRWQRRFEKLQRAAAEAEADHDLTLQRLRPEDEGVTRDEEHGE